ncbi:hypothetical protein FGO68_gene3040 [Halteria grandinella]|uniref:PAS domain-containing protein n=1 Tax=Halteria grandinella TaxID=5974 RepID=A0A8J8P5G2_HALGN|nr:hypothetical protein FGO68_gene3040 [Halteria grandinella]
MTLAKGNLRLLTFDRLSENDGISSGSSMRKISSQLRKRLFKINFVLFHRRPIGSFVYQLFLIIEFFQLFFLTYYSVSSRNGFINPRKESLSVESYMGKLLSQLSGQKYNLTEEAERLESMLSKIQLTTIQNNLFRMDEFAKFAIPNLYYLNSDGEDDFYSTYWVATGIFYGVIALYFGLGPILFKIHKQSQQSEAFKILTLILANIGKDEFDKILIIVLILVTLAQVPIFTLLFQGFLCDEDPLQDYTIPSVSCGNSKHQLYVLFSIITLLLYIGLTCIVFILKHSERLGSTQPWAAFNSTFPLVKVGVKLILSASFILDKKAEYKSEVAFAALGLILYKLIRRFRDSVYFNRQVHKTSTSLDIILAYHLLFINIHLVAHELQSVSTVFIFLLNSLVFVALYQAVQGYQLNQMKKCETDQIDKRGVHSFNIYCEQMFTMIKRLDDQDKMILFGRLYNHAQDCKNLKTCMCGDLMDKLENIKKFKVFKEKVGIRKDCEDDIVKQSSKETPTITSFNMIKDLHTKELSTFHDQAMTSGTFLNPLFHAQAYTGQLSASPRDGNQDYDGTPHREGEAIRENLLIEDEFQSINVKYEELFGHPIEVEFVEENQWYLDLDRQNHQNDKIRRVFYQFIIQLLENVAIKEPHNASLRLQVTSLLKNQLSKIFRSYYELQKCVQMKDMSLNERYQEFEHHKLIEQQLIGLHGKQQSTLLDVEHLIEYNKSFLKFQKNEIMAARATLNFWRQLLQRDFNSQILQQHGFEITRCFAKVTDAAQEINRISPGDIKFHFRLGMFLIKIINNEYDGVEALRTANIKYVLHSDNKEEGKIDSTGEVPKVVFSEGHGFGLVVLSTNAAQFGRIIHANCEIESIFGYQRKEILNRHISCLMPHLIGKHHDHFVRKFLQSGNIRFSDIIRQSFAQNKE